MPGVIKTTAPISPDQKAVIDKYGFEVDAKDGSWYVNDDVAFRKNALKDASKKGRYIGKTLDETLKQAVEVRKEINGEKPDKVEAPTIDADTDAASETASKLPGLKGGKKNTAATRGGPGKGKTVAQAVAESPKDDEDEEDESEPAPKKTRKTRESKKDNRYRRASKVLVANLGIPQADLAKAAEMSVASAGHCLEAWEHICRTLIEKGWLTGAPAASIMTRFAAANEKKAAAAAAKKTAKKTKPAEPAKVVKKKTAAKAKAEPAPEPAPTPKPQPTLRKKTKAA